MVDMFAPGYAWPLRFEFFGDTIENIRCYDPATQRAQTELERIVLLPVAPAVITDASRQAALRLWESMAVTGELRREAQAALIRRIEAGDGNIWPGLFYEKPATLTAHLPRDAVYLLYDASRCVRVWRRWEFGWETVSGGRGPGAGLWLARPEAVLAGRHGPQDVAGREAGPIRGPGAWSWQTWAGHARKGRGAFLGSFLETRRGQASLVGASGRASGLGRLKAAGGALFPWGNVPGRNFSR